MIKEFFMRKLLERQLKNVPKEQQEMIMTLFKKDPKLLEQIAKEFEVEMKKGKTQVSAAMTVLPKYQKQLRELMGK